MGCCARAASGQAAAPPSAASNSRRPMVTIMRPSRARVRKWNDTTPRASCPNCVARRGWGGTPGTGLKGSPPEHAPPACFQGLSAPASGPQRLIMACGVSAISGCEQSQQTRFLFDHLVGKGEQRRLHFKAERLGSLEVDDQVVLGGRLHRKVGGFFSLENA